MAMVKQRIERKPDKIRTSDILNMYYMSKKKLKSNIVFIGILVIILFFVFLFVRKGFYSNQKEQIGNTPTATPEIVKDFSTVKKIVSDGRAQGHTTVFTPFELDIPSGWTLIDQRDDVVAILSKDEYLLTIAYPIEGSICNFPDTEYSDGPAENFNVQSEFKTEFGLIRVGKPEYRPDLKLEKQYFRVCQKEKNSEYWTIVLPVGVIWYQTPLSPNQSVLSEMNTIVKSIKLTNP